MNLLCEGEGEGEGEHKGNNEKAPNVFLESLKFFKISSKVEQLLLKQNFSLI